MKKIVALIVSMLLVLSFVGCGTANNTTNTNDNKELKIGIIQYMSHPSLDNCYNGIIEGLKASNVKYTVDYKTGSSNSADNDCVNFAKNMVAENFDLIIAIATPAAKAAFSATDNTDIPVIFCAVSDPVAAGLVESNDKPGFPCTGTSDVLDLAAQVELIKGFQKDVKSIGILYTSSEENSISNLKRFKEVCESQNIEVVASAVQNGADIPAAAEELASKVDCINNFTDNNVVNNLQVVLNAAEKNNIPVYGSEEEQVKNGCLASISIDYVALGKVTGEMAAQVLGGEDASKMAVKSIKDGSAVVNEQIAQKLGLSYSGTYTAVK